MPMLQEPLRDYGRFCG